MSFTVYAAGLVHASVCTSLALEEATRRLNIERPTGISSQWRKSADEHFSNGPQYPNGMPCPDHPVTHRHWLFSC